MKDIFKEKVDWVNSKLVGRFSSEIISVEQYILGKIYT